MIEINQDILKSIYKKRPVDAHKYDFGLLLVIGGGRFYSGSPALAALAAFRSGVDMVNIIAPKRAADIIAGFSPNLSAYPLEGDWLTKGHLPTLLSMTQNAKLVSNDKTAVVIGGGLGRSKETQETIEQYFLEIDVPVVIDADAIYVLKEKPEIIKAKNFLITPHSYEFLILTGQEVAGKSIEEKAKIVQEQAERLATTILLKGAIDVISNGKETAINRLGCPYLTKGGTGDTLAGICGSLITQGIDCFTAAQAAAYINVKAGIIATKNKKQGLLATDLIEAIPSVLKD